MTRGNFTHVLAFSAVEGLPFIQVIDPVRSFTDVRILYHPHGSHILLNPDVIALDFSCYGGRVVRLETFVSRRPRSHHLTNWFPGCVTVCKGLIGLADWVFTPWQFYRWLLEHGGVEYDSAHCEALFRGMTGAAFTPANLFRMWGVGAMPKHDNAAAQQQQRLKDEEKRANAAAAAQEAENQRVADARRRQLLGQSSLITTSALGVQDTLGV